jgi:hypothetical protein
MMISACGGIIAHVRLLLLSEFLHGNTFLRHSISGVETRQSTHQPAVTMAATNTIPATGSIEPAP